MKSSLSSISFMHYATDGVSKKSYLSSSPYPRSSTFSFMLSSRSFIVLHFTFRFVTYFEVIFVKGIRSVSRFISLHVAVQLFQHHLLKRLSLPHCIFCSPLSKITWLYLRKSISGLSVLFHWSVYLFFDSTKLFLITVVL